MKVLTVYVRDEDGAEAAEAPALVGLAPVKTGLKSLLGYMSVSPGQYVTAENRWKFTVNIDLRKNPVLLKEAADAGMIFQAISSLGKRSAEVPVQFRLFPNVGVLQTSWGSDVKVVQGGKESHIPFVVYADSFRGSIEVAASRLMEGAELNCAMTLPGLMSCELVWAPPAVSSPRTADFTLDAVLKSSDPQDTRSVTRRFNPLLKVVP